MFSKVSSIRKRLLGKPVVRKCWHVYVCKIWSNYVMSISLNADSRTDKQNQPVIIGHTCNWYKIWNFNESKPYHCYTIYDRNHGFFFTLIIRVVCLCCVAALKVFTPLYLMLVLFQSSWIACTITLPRISSISMWCPRSGVVLDRFDSWSLLSSLLWMWIEQRILCLQSDTISLSYTDIFC